MRCCCSLSFGFSAPRRGEAHKRNRPSFRQNKEITFSCHGAVWVNPTSHRCHPGKPEPRVVVSALLQSCIFPSKQGGVSVGAPRPRPGAGSAQAGKRDVRAGGWLRCGPRVLARRRLRPSPRPGTVQARERGLGPSGFLPLQDHEENILPRAGSGLADDTLGPVQARLELSPGPLPSWACGVDLSLPSRSPCKERPDSWAGNAPHAAPATPTGTPRPSVRGPTQSTVAGKRRLRGRARDAQSQPRAACPGPPTTACLRAWAGGVRTHFVQNWPGPQGCVTPQASPWTAARLWVPLPGAGEGEGGSQSRWPTAQRVARSRAACPSRRGLNVDEAHLSCPRP